MSTSRHPPPSDAPGDAAGVVDVHGVRHLVSFTPGHHGYWDGSGWLEAGCTCGWADIHGYGPKQRAGDNSNQSYARWKLACRAVDHLPPLKPRRTQPAAPGMG